MRTVFLGLALGIVSAPVFALDEPPAPVTPPSSTNTRDARAAEPPTEAPPAARTPDPLPTPPTPPAETPEPRPAQTPASNRPPAPPASTGQPILPTAPFVTGPRHGHYHQGPIRMVVNYSDWVWTRGWIVLTGYPSPRDLQKRAADPQAYTLPQTKPAPPPRKKWHLFHH